MDLDDNQEDLILETYESICNNFTYLKKAASQYGCSWKDKYDNTREYSSKQVGDANANNSFKVPVNIVPAVKKCTQNKKLQSPELEP
ncbi:6314_t:CDS:2 [Scutellospora calospora]|uniref:6314_t:CDS:1 n=1 Tax=Scutellospora calospora TaxID=85575 RepID=A0ACA9KTB6_9GLOM|nr:6314_t:CDS:2 [Scutellospora calospora]